MTNTIVLQFHRNYVQWLWLVRILHRNGLVFMDSDNQLLSSDSHGEVGLQSSPSVYSFNRDIIDGFIDVLNTKSPEKVIEFYHPRCSLVTPSHTFAGVAQVGAWYQRLFTQELPGTFFVKTGSAGNGHTLNFGWIARDRASIFAPSRVADFHMAGKSVEGIEIFKGVHYKKIVRSSPRTHTIYVASIDLNDPTVHLLVTPPAGLGKTTSDFMSHYGLQIAVNGDEWTSWTNPKGLAVSEGVQYSASSFEPTVYISASNQVQIGGPAPAVLWNAISGSHTLMRNGQINRKLRTCSKPDVYCKNLAPRTSIGLTRGNKLILTVVQGPGDSLRDALTLKELANLNLEMGAFNAISLDGGGSSTLVADDFGIPTVLNSPSDGKERVVSNHLGIRAGYLEEGSAQTIGEGNDTLGMLDGKIVYHFTSFNMLPKSNL